MSTNHKFHADTMNHSEVVEPKFIVRTFLAAEFFLITDILLRMT